MSKARHQGDDQTESPGDNPESRKGFPAVLWIGLLLVLAYPLSLGPVLVLIDKGLLPRDAFQLYSPLNELANHSTTAAHVLQWYVGIWGWAPPPK